MSKQEDRIYIEAIKLAAGSLQYRGLPVKKIFVQTIEWMEMYYHAVDEIDYLIPAFYQIQAYLEIGFSYEENKWLFDWILEALGGEYQCQISKAIHRQKKVKLNKSQVRCMIKRWPASSRGMKINEVVADIIEKVKNRKNGITIYKNEVNGEWYELIINEEEIFFHDTQRGDYFTFIK